MNQTRRGIIIPNAYQRIFDPYRIKVLDGGRGSAKSESIGRYYLIKSGQIKGRFLCTREYQTSIADSVYKVLTDIIEDEENDIYNNFEYNKQTIVNKVTGSDFIFKGLQDINGIKSTKGITDCWVEEAHSIRKTTLKVLTPTIRENNSEIIFSLNRLTELDPVIEEFCMIPDPDVLWLHTTFRDNPYFPAVLRTAMLKDKERNMDLYRHIWEGEPLVLGEKAILSRAEIAGAFEREITVEGQIEIGVDVARFGDDRTVLTMRKGLKMIESKTYGKLDVVQVAQQVKNMANGDKSMLIKVDSTGVGGGVADILRADGYNAIDINFGSSAKEPDKYNNLISEAWFEFKDVINNAQLIHDEDLRNELATREWHIDNKGRRCVESKDDYKKRGYRSPDKADALLIAFYNCKQQKVVTGIFNFEKASLIS